jgi:two-component system LytT family response regulator
MIKNLIEPLDDFELVAECQTGKQVVAAISEHAPDVVFLDVKMPEMDGLEVVKTLEFAKRPLIVLVTAFDQYAVDAFGLRVFDYLVKPVKASRFNESVTHIRAAIQNRRNMSARTLPDDAVDGVLHAPDKEANKYLTIRSGDEVLYIRPDEVSAFEAENQYVRLRTASGSYLISTESLNSLEASLDTNKFIRIHRATIINLALVKSIKKLAASRRAVQMLGGEVYPISRRNMVKLGDIADSLSKHRLSKSKGQHVDLHAELTHLLQVKNDPSQAP